METMQNKKEVEIFIKGIDYKLSICKFINNRIRTNKNVIIKK